MISGRLLTALAAPLLLAACGNLSEPSNNTTERFTGSIPVTGRGTIHTFTVGKTGEYTVTLTDLTPATGNAIALGFGNPSGSDCAIASTVAVLRGQQPLGGSINKGSYCLVLFDPGTMTQPETYTLTVVHP